MNRKMKSVGMWLLLGSLSTGMAYADLSKNESEIDIVQQTGICQGIVKDATGESVIGASVITRVRDKDCVKNRVKRAKIVRFTLC